MKVQNMVLTRWIAVFGGVLLAACAGNAPLAPPQQVNAPDGSKSVVSTPARLSCGQPRCPTLTARWDSQRAGVVLLDIGLPYQQAQVERAEFHFGRSQVVRLQIKSAQPALQAGFPSTAFDVPLSLIEAMAYKPDGWVRVATDDGRVVDETIRTGEEESDVVQAMREFLHLVDGATGKQVDRKGGGLFDLLK